MFFNNAMSRKPSYCITTVLFLVSFLLVGRVFAQAPPPIPTQDPTATESARFQQNWDRFRIERQIQQATSPMPGVQVTSPQLPPPDLEGSSQVKIFKLNQVLFQPIPKAVPQVELEAVAAKYIAMEAVSIYDLYLMIVEIDALFDKRHVLGRAGLPVQDVESGVVTVEIVEGRETKRTVTNKVPPYFSGAGDALAAPSVHRLFGRLFVQDQLRFSGKSSFNLQDLEEEILRYNRTFRSQLVAEIEPGDDLGDCTLKLTRILSQPVSGGYYVDNSGRESSGRIRQGVYMNFSDILGANESFFMSYDKTEGTTALYMQGDMPISRYGTFFDMSYYFGEPKTISGPSAVLEINGTSEQSRPGLRQILVNQKEQRLDAAFYYQTYDSKTYFDTALNYAEKHDAWTFGFEYSQQKKKSATFAGMFFVAGQATTLAPIPAGYVDNDFNLLKMNLMKVWYPSKKWTLILRGNGSAALSGLPQSQVFQIGGMATVRGTPEALMSAESGYLAVAEARRLLWSGCNSKWCCSSRKNDSLVNCLRKDWKHHSKAELFAFFDNGGVFHKDSAPEVDSADFLFSIGAGGTVNLGRHCLLTGGYGHPILTAESHAQVYRDMLSKGNAFFTARVSF